MLCKAFPSTSNPSTRIGPIARAVATLSPPSPRTLTTVEHVEAQHPEFMHVDDLDAEMAAKFAQYQKATSAITTAAERSSQLEALLGVMERFEAQLDEQLLVRPRGREGVPCTIYLCISSAFALLAPSDLGVSKILNFGIVSYECRKCRPLWMTRSSVQQSGLPSALSERLLFSHLQLLLQHLRLWQSLPPSIRTQFKTAGKPWRSSSRCPCLRLPRQRLLLRQRPQSSSQSWLPSSVSRPS